MSEKTLFSFIFRCFWMKYKGDDHAMAHANITSVLIQSRNDFKLQLWNMPTGGFGDLLLCLQLCESWPFSTVFYFILFQKIVSMLLTKYFFWGTIKEQCFQGRKCLGHDGGSYGRDGRHSHRWYFDLEFALYLFCIDKIQSAQSPLHHDHSLLRMGPGPVCDKHGSPQGGVPAQLEDAGRALLCRRSWTE